MKLLPAPRPAHSKVQGALRPFVGVPYDYDDGFGLIRASNTTPVVVLRFEADSQAALARIQDEFRSALNAVWPGIRTDF